jgi:hypothetical protein
MFDSENIPLVTRFESGDGVSVSFTVNGDGEGVYKAKLDSEYLISLVDKVLLFDQNLLFGLGTRLGLIETLLGINAPTPPAPPASSSFDSDGIGFISYTQGVPLALSGQLSYRWRLLSFDENEIASKDIRVGAGTAAQDVLRILMYTILQSPSVVPYLREMRMDDSPGGGAVKIAFKFKPIYNRFKFSIVNLNNTVPSDGSKFTIVQQVR